MDRMMLPSNGKLGADPRWAAFEAAALRYRDDAPWRARIDDGESEALSGLMSDISLTPAPGASVRVRANDDSVFHVIMPPDPNMTVADETLAGVVGGARAGTMASLSSAGTAGCSTAPSTLGTAASASTAAP